MYDRKVDGRTLRFRVSGQLWNRSLVMMDVETKTLWSHLLGRAMQGHLKGKQLQPIPAEMTTWADWKKRFPNTTVLALPRTNHSEYTKQFYRNPQDFVVGVVVDGKPFHVSMATLQRRPVMNTQAASQPLVILFDPESTSVRVYERRVGDNVLTFGRGADGLLRDRETNSTWDHSGTATTGALKGKSLKAVVGIMSYADVWPKFHPTSRQLSGR